MKKYILLLIGVTFLITSCGKETPEQQVDKLMSELEAKQKPILEKVLAHRITKIDQEIDQKTKDILSYSWLSIDEKNEKIEEFKKLKAEEKEQARILLLGSFEEVAKLIKENKVKGDKDDYMQLLLMNPAIANFAYRDPINFLRTIALEVSDMFAEKFKKDYDKAMEEALNNENISEEDENASEEDKKIAEMKNKEMNLFAQILKLQAEYYEKGIKAMGKK